MRMLLVLLLTLLGRPAVAVSVSQEDLAHMVRRVGPVVEELVGRDFDGYPTLVLTEADTATKELQQQRLELLLASGALSPGRARRLARRSTRREIQGALALYVDGQIYLLADRVEELFSERALRAHLLSPVIQCVLAHELAHALQDQVAPMRPPTDWESALVALAVSEGFASLVQVGVCHALGHAEAQQVMDREQGLLNRDLDPGDLVYGLGRAYMAVRYEQEGREGLWSALRDPPADYASLLATVYPRDPRSEALVDLFTSCSVAMGVDPVAGQLQPAVFDDLSPMSEGAAHQIAVVGIVDAVRFEARSAGGEAVVISAAWFRGDGQAGQFVEALHRELKDARKELQRLVGDMSGGLLQAELNHILVPFRAARRRLDADASFGMEQRPGPGMRQRAYWAARGDLLVVVFLSGVHARKGRVVDAIEPLFTYVPLDGDFVTGSAE